MPANESTPPKGNESTDRLATPAVMGEVLIEPTEIPADVDTTEGLVDVSFRSTEASLRIMFEPVEARELIDELTEAVDAIDERDELDGREAAE